MIPDNVWQQRFTLTADGLFLRNGWYPVEQQKDSYFRWLGPGPLATVHFSPRRDQEYRLNILIHAAANEAVLSGLVLEADGVPLQITIGAGRAPTYVTAVLPKDSAKLPGRETVLTFRVPSLATVSEASPGNSGKRPVGIALQVIHVFPLARPLFVAEKFADLQPFDGLDYLRQHPGVREAVVHGLYGSAYEYYNDNHQAEGNYAPNLHAKFDECPGDQFDILAEMARTKAAASEQRLREEIELLRCIVQRQGDHIRTLKAELAGRDVNSGKKTVKAS